MQDRRFAGRVRQEMAVDPRVHDAIVPTMILQPIVENAYGHGLSKLTSSVGVLSIEASTVGSVLRLCVTNSGTGLRPIATNGNGNGNGSGKGVGLANVQDRLKMHYGNDYTFSISEIEDNRVQVVMTLPLHLAARPIENTTGYGA
jgi:LytS/YehU family sensor histidine kinase